MKTEAVVKCIYCRKPIEQDKDSVVRSSGFCSEECREGFLEDKKLWDYEDYGCD